MPGAGKEVLPCPVTVGTIRHMRWVFTDLRTAIMRRLPLWVRIGLLVGAAVAPLLAFSLLVVYTGYQTRRQDASQQALNIARSLALSVDNELHTRIATLEILAMSRALATGDLVTFRDEVDAVVALQSPGAYVALVREDGQQLLNTGGSPGAPLPVSRQLENLRRVFVTGLPSVSDVYIGAVVQRPLVAIEVPVRRADESVGLVLAMTPTLETFASVIRNQKPAEGWIIAVLDRAGVRIARIPTDDRLVGRPALPDFLAAWSTHREGVVEAITPDGVPVLAAFSRPSDDGWGVSVAIPTAQLTGPALHSAIAATTIALLMFTLGAWLAFGFSRSVTGPISALRRFAATSNDAGGEPSPAMETGLAEVDEVAVVLRAELRRTRAAQSSLEIALKERTAALMQRDRLLREVYHRVKNNLQMVDGLLMMQARQLSDSEAKEGLAMVRCDVQALGLVHDQLMKSADLETFDVAPFLHELSSNIVAGGSDRSVSLYVDAIPLMVTLDFAIPLALLVTELVGNCLKYAFTQDKGRISLTLRRNAAGEVVLLVSDDGAASAAPVAGDTDGVGYGINIVQGMVGQLDGVMKVSYNNGRHTEVRLAVHGAFQ
jgi:two-component sensor histidine kinase